MTLIGAGVDVVIVTPTGGIPVVDERSVDPGEVGEGLTEHVVKVHESDERLQSLKLIAQVDADEYDTVVLPGGHGTAWGINQDRHARQVFLQAVAGDDSEAFVVCYATGILGFTREADGSFLVEGREAIGFPNKWKEGIVDDDDLMPDGRKLPYWVEDEMRAVDGVWDAELDSDTSVAMDSSLITARGPSLSAAAAQTLLDEL